MPENGKNGSKWVRWVLGVVLVTVLPFMGTVIWSNDKDSRSRDIRQKDELVKICRVQSTVNQKILISLARIETDMVYIKQKVCP